MEKQGFYKALFDVTPLPKELRSSIDQADFKTFLNSRLYSSVHNHPHELLLRPGQISHMLYYVEKGMIRAYYKNEAEEKENTIFIWDEGSIATDHSSFFTKVPSEIFLEVIRGSELVYISCEGLSEVYSAFPYIEAFITCIIGRHAMKSSRRINDLISLPAWERYIETLNTYSKIEQLVSKDVIASFIGITRPSLSRLIKENGHP